MLGLCYDTDIYDCPVVREVNAASKFNQVFKGEAHRCVLVRGEPLRFTLPALSLVTSLLCGAESMSL